MFKIEAEPTFLAVVKIRAAGGKILELNVVFRHKKRDEVHQYFADCAENGKPDVDCILELVESWDADKALAKESVLDLMQNYSVASKAIFATYLDELTQARLGN